MRQTTKKLRCYTKVNWEKRLENCGDIDYKLMENFIGLYRIPNKNILLNKRESFQSEHPIHSNQMAENGNKGITFSSNNLFKNLF